MKNNKLPKPITILIVTLLTTLFWISMSIYRNLTVKPPLVVATNVSKSLTPNLNTDVLKRIDTAVYIPDIEIPPLNLESKSVVVPIPTPMPNIEATKSASPAAQI